jgi:hypothetical protein
MQYVVHMEFVTSTIPLLVHAWTDFSQSIVKIGILGIGLEDVLGRMNQFAGQERVFRR